jgi:pilus assembly protein CpaC
MRAHAQTIQPSRRLIAALILLVAVVGRSTLYAQTPAPAQQPVAVTAALDSAPPPVEPAADAVRLLVGRSTIVDVGRPIARVSLTSADIADALVTSPNELLVNGKAPGTISLFVWDRGGSIRRYEVIVQRDLARLSAQIKELFPKESIEVRPNGRSAVLAGTVSSKDVADKMVSLAGAFVDNKDELVSLLQVGPAGRSNQVLLRVRFAEVSRSAMTELGLGLFTSPTGIENTIGRVTTQQFPAPNFEELEHTKSGPDAFDFGGDVDSSSGKFTFSDFLNLFLYNQKYDLGLTIRALQSRGLFQSLAEPNLIAESGKEASFLAGGEFPIPVAQASSGGTSISIQFKEFGIRLNFTPTVNGDRVHLKVRPEVSALDFTNAITLQGFRIPALTTRRTETEVELNNGQTFAIAGLMNNQMNQTIQKIPGLGDIPILGYLFRSKAAQKNQTELVVMITPEILQNDSPGVTPNLPRQAEPYLPPLTDRQTAPAQPPAFRSSSAATPTTAPVVDAAKPSAPAANMAPSPTNAAAVLTATSPANGDVVQAPAAEPAAQSATPAPAAAPQDPRAVERARREERARQEAEARAQAEEARRQARQAEEDRRKAKAEAEEQAKLAREQAIRDAEDAKRAEEAARRQAEADRKRQQAEAEAERRLKEAQAAYEAELARIQRR